MVHECVITKKYFSYINSLFATFADLHIRNLPSLPICTSVNLPCSPIAVIPMAIIHSYCSMTRSITIVSGSHCAHALLIWLFGFSIIFTGKKILRVDSNSISKMVPQFQCAP